MLGQDQADNFERQFFDYVLDRVVPASAVQDANQLQILTDADFELWWLAFTSTSAALQVLMSEAATGRSFIGQSPAVGAGFNGPFIGNWIPVNPFPLAVPYVMPASRVYTLLFTDTSAAPNTVEIAFKGFKLWPKPQ